MFRTLFKRKCGNSDFLARRDDVRCEKSFAYKNRCLNVRSATANKKKNRNANEKRSTKSINSTDFCHVVSPKANRSACSYENDVRSNSKAGISKKLISFDSDELIAACKRRVFFFIYHNLSLTLVHKQWTKSSLLIITYLTETAKSG